MGKRFLFVTANHNETHALLSEELYVYESGVRSADPDDTLFYNRGSFGRSEVIHFELPEQGSIRADASFPSILTAIQQWNPDAVVLVGIAFGKDNANSAEPCQHIGDVLISTHIIDYESGKIQDRKVRADGSQPDSGRHLLAAFKHYSDSWEYRIDGRKAECYFGKLLSGDKVVDDSDFKQLLFDAYPRAIGGEMEGRGAYSACRRKGLNEWIVVKAICDWGEDKNNPNKERDQVNAARSVVALLRHVFMHDDAFDKLPTRTASAVVKSISEAQRDPEQVIGYCVNVGTTSCRLLEVRRNNTLKEVVVSTYDVTDSENAAYLDGIISCVKKELLPCMRGNPSQLLQKVFVDTGFTEIFDGYGDPAMQRDFIRNFYQQTNLYFNILSKKQTEENLKRLFRDLRDRTAVINVGSHGVDILRYDGGNFYMHWLEVTLADIRGFVERSGFAESWSDAEIEKTKAYVRKRLKKQLEDIRIDNAIIIKDELCFMRDMGYPLVMSAGQLMLTQAAYKSANRRLLYCVDYMASLRSRYADQAAVHRLYGFRYGHLLIETILDRMHNKNVIPKDDLSIHGSHLNAYIFNVVISGSIQDGRHIFMVEANDIIQKMGANVLSPMVLDGRLARSISEDSEYEHLKAIDECDVLFICNQGDDGYIGESTKCEIYYAYALKKTIAFWREPPDDRRLSFIPHEHWGSIKLLVG